MSKTQTQTPLNAHCIIPDPPGVPSELVAGRSHEHLPLKQDVLVIDSEERKKNKSAEIMYYNNLTKIKVCQPTETVE